MGILSIAPAPSDAWLVQRMVCGDPGAQWWEWRAQRVMVFIHYVIGDPLDGTHEIHAFTGEDIQSTHDAELHEVIGDLHSDFGEWVVSAQSENEAIDSVISMGGDGNVAFKRRSR